MKFTLDEIAGWHRVAVADSNYRIDRMARLTAQERELIDRCVPDLLAEVKRLTDELAKTEGMLKHSIDVRATQVGDQWRKDAARTALEGKK